MGKLLCITLSAGFLCSLAWTAARGTEPIDTLASIWESQESEIVTAHIKCRLVRLGKEGIAPLSRQQFHQVFAKLDSKNQSKVFKALTDRACKIPSKSNKPGASIEYFYEGTRYKELILKSSDCHVFNGELEANFDSANQQAMVYNLGASRLGVRYLRDFRMVPNPKVKKDATLTGRTGDRVEFKAGRNPLIVDGTTGVLYQYSHCNDKGQVTEEIIQDCYATYPGGVIFPSLSIRVMYDAKGVLSNFTASWVDTAEFNRDLPKDAFTFPVPGNTVIFDKRLAGHLRSFRMLAPEPDVFAVVKTAFDTSGAIDSNSSGVGGSNSRPRMWWSLGMGGVAILLSLTGWLFFRKRFFTTA